MGDTCINLSDVKNSFVRSAISHYNKNGDGKVCKKEIPEKDKAAFEQYVQSERVIPSVEAAFAEVDGKKIIKKQFDCLAEFASINKLDLNKVLSRTTVENGYVIKLDLLGTRISDISPLKNLTNLVVLNLGNTKVKDVSPLKDLINLKLLILAGTQVSDIGPLKDLANLERLNLSFTKVSDVGPLKNLNLKTLDLSFTKVSDIWPLFDLINLEELNVSYTQVSDASPVYHLPLKFLGVAGSKINQGSLPMEMRHKHIIH